MVMFTGLWNSSQYIERQPFNVNVNVNTKPPSTIQYGSTAGTVDETSATGTAGTGTDTGTDTDGKSVTWSWEQEDDTEENHDTTTHEMHGGSTASTGTSISSEQEFPSLTAAFRSLENRSIVVNCMWYLAIYFTVAVIAYSFVLEKWTIIDSLYFAVATFTTCGYGDHEPTTVPGQLFTIFFAIYGVIILGVFIAIFGSFISEAQTKAMTRFQSKSQQQMIDTLFRQSDRKLQQSGFWSDHVSLADDIWRVVMAELPLILIVALMALILGIREGWGLTSTLYFCIMAATTTGYGDYTPSTQIDKLYCVFLLPLAVAVFGEVLGRIANVYIQRKQRIAQAKFLHRSLTLCDLRNMDTDSDGKVNREEFLCFMLVALQKVDRATIDELKSIFDSLDTNKNGLLEEADLVELAEENYLPTVQQIKKEIEDVTTTTSSLNILDPNLTFSTTHSTFSRTSSNSSHQRHKRHHTIL